MRLARFASLAFATVTTVVGLTSPAQALTVNGSGVVTNWNVTPFSSANQVNTATSTGAFSIENNTSPINYGGSIGNTPSGGEAYDFEEMYTRVSSNTLQILVVSSSDSQAGGFNRGDLFVTLNGTRYAIVSLASSEGHAAGSVYKANDAADVVGLQPGSGSYAGNGTIEAQAGPWAVAAGISSTKLLASAATIATASFNYGGVESPSYLWEYTVALSDFGLTSLSNFTFDAHQTWGCGNDVIDAAGSFTGTTAVPTPAALPAGLGLLALVGLIKRRNNRA